MNLRASYLFFKIYIIFTHKQLKKKKTKNTHNVNKMTIG